jgi:hypothetical protein
VAKSRKSKPAAAKAEEYVSSSTTIGIAFEMPEESIAASMADEMPIDFQAKQDSISEIRRSPGTKLAPKIKRTSAKPAKAKETEVKL